MKLQVTTPFKLQPVTLEISTSRIVEPWARNLYFDPEWRRTVTIKAKGLRVLHTDVYMSLYWRAGRYADHAYQMTRDCTNEYIRNAKTNEQASSAVQKQINRWADQYIVDLFAQNPHLWAIADREAHEAEALRLQEVNKGLQAEIEANQAKAKALLEKAVEARKSEGAQIRVAGSPAIEIIPAGSLSLTF